MVDGAVDVTGNVEGDVIEMVLSVEVRDVIFNFFSKCDI